MRKKHELIIGEEGSDSNGDEESEAKRGVGDKVNVGATRD